MTSALRNEGAANAGMPRTQLVLNMCHVCALSEPDQSQIRPCASSLIDLAQGLRATVVMGERDYALKGVACFMRRLKNRLFPI